MAEDAGAVKLYEVVLAISGALVILLLSAVAISSLGGRMKQWRITKAEATIKRLEALDASDGHLRRTTSFTDSLNSRTPPRTSSTASLEPGANRKSGHSHNADPATSGRLSNAQNAQKGSRSRSFERQGSDRLDVRSGRPHPEVVERWLRDSALRGNVHAIRAPPTCPPALSVESRHQSTVKPLGGAEGGAHRGSNWSSLDAQSGAEDLEELPAGPAPAWQRQSLRTRTEPVMAWQAAGRPQSTRWRSSRRTRSTTPTPVPTYESEPELQVVRTLSEVSRVTIV